MKMASMEVRLAVFRASKEFLRLAEKSKKRVLPRWWNKEKAKDCEKLGRQRGWSSLSSAVEKSDIVEHYGDPVMPMQLRMLAEWIYGSNAYGY